MADPADSEKDAEQHSEQDSGQDSQAQSPSSGGRRRRPSSARSARSAKVAKAPTRTSSSRRSATPKAEPGTSRSSSRSTNDDDQDGRGHSEGHDHDDEGRSGGQSHGRLSGRRAARLAALELAEMTGKEFEGVVGIRRVDGEWHVEIEVLEVSRIPTTTDVLAVYEVTLDASGELVEYERTARYLRGDAGKDRE